MIETLSLFRPLNQKLIDLLKVIPKADWSKKTVAGAWTVKDVAAHLLDGNVRAISMYRDHAELKPDVVINNYSDIVQYLNRLNADWVRAMNRVSPEQLLEQLEQTHEPYIQCLEKLNPFENAMFSVAWAGEEVSTNWFHIARELTEKWHHQQQIRDALGQQGILTKQFYKPVLETFMRALPHRYKDIGSADNTSIKITIESEAGGTWWLEKKAGQWILLSQKGDQIPSVTISIPADLSWKIFTKAVQFENVRSLITIEGDENLALPTLKMITVMA
ncbi:MAG: maleylpyruvate isomerase family protein [Cyclobacteriaceae bacterium]|nr:maleylpyruvate isomerase family protein [Cyclobacteriaceae bacterium]